MARLLFQISSRPVTIRANNIALLNFFENLIEGQAQIIFCDAKLLLRGITMIEIHHVRWVRIATIGTGTIFITAHDLSAALVNLQGSGRIADPAPAMKTVFTGF
jgi:hypothetical protein